MKQVDLIIFDLDGTLVDSRADIANAVNFTLRKLHLKEKDLEEITSYIGGGVRDLMNKSIGKNKEHFEKAISVFEEYYRKHFADSSILYPHVIEILEYFKNKQKVIVTNRNYEFAALTLKKFAIFKFFEKITGGDNLGCMKPRSCPLDNAIDKFDIDKEKAIIVGDMDIDILAGKKAGIITCAVTYGIGKKSDIIKAEPDFVVDDIIKLKEIVY